MTSGRSFPSLTLQDFFWGGPQFPSSPILFWNFPAGKSGELLTWQGAFSSCIDPLLPGIAKGIHKQVLEACKGRSGVTAAQSPSQGLVLASASLAQGHRELFAPGEEHSPGCMKTAHHGASVLQDGLRLWLCRKVLSYKVSGKWRNEEQGDRSMDLE